MEMRNTIQRELVRQAVNCLYHPTAEEVYLHIKASHPNISKGTVYRNLNQLVGRGALYKVALPGMADRFDITLDKHYHICCRVCGRVEDVELPEQGELISGIPNTHGFTIESHDIVLKGVCPACRDRMEPERDIDPLI